MVAAYVAELERLVSKPRLDRYRPANRDDLETVVRYLWNIALSEALMQGLAALEVGLRNSVHTTLADHIGTDQWFWAVLKNDEVKTVNETWTKLATRLKQPPSAGKIIAELTFGFWPRLFDQRYHKLWWDNHAALLWAVFPNYPLGLPPKQALTPKLIRENAEMCTNLRNRVMHHEPIFMGITRLNLPRLPLVNIHRVMVDMLNWIDPQLALTLSFVDRFPDVHHYEEGRIRARLKQYFNIS